MSARHEARRLLDAANTETCGTILVSTNFGAVDNLLAAAPRLLAALCDELDDAQAELLRVGRLGNAVVDAIPGQPTGRLGEAVEAWEAR